MNRIAKRVRQQHGIRYSARAQPRSDLFDYIEVFYNRIRPHVLLNNLSPAKFERHYYQQYAQAA